MNKVQVLILAFSFFYSMNCFCNNDVKFLSTELWGPISWGVTPQSSKDNIINYGHHDLVKYSYTLDERDVFKKLDPKNLLSNNERRDLVKRAYESLLSQDNTSLRDKKSQFTKLQGVLKINGLKVSEMINKSVETLNKYQALGTEDFINYLRENYKGKELSEVASSFIFDASITDENEALEHQRAFIRLALDGDPSRKMVYDLFRNYISINHDVVDLKLEELFSEHANTLSYLKIQSLPSNTIDTVLCHSVKDAYAYTNKYSHDRELKYLNENGSLDGYISDDPYIYNSAISKQEVQRDVALSLVNKLHSLQDLGIDFQIPCSNGKMPFDYLKDMLENGFLDHVDKSSLYLLGVAKKPCEQRNISNLDLGNLCTIGGILEKLDNEVKGNNNVIKKRENLNLEMVYAQSFGKCTISMFDRVVKKQGEILSRSTKVFVNGGKLIGSTNEVDIKPFIKDLKSNFSK